MTKDELFPILDTIAQGVAATFGANCETLIQDLTFMEHPILSIYNGQVTGRSAGSVSSLRDEGDSDFIPDIKTLQSPHINLLAGENGQALKSTTIPIRADDGVLGFCINFDFTGLQQAELALRSLSEINGFLYRELQQDAPSPMDTMLQEAASIFGKDITDLSKSERQGLLRRLHAKQFFDRQRAVPYLADKLGVSRYTIYKDLKEIGAE